MLIRKLFKFENAHIVRNCSSERCRSSIHGHSYKVEVIIASDVLDNGQMVMDFGLLKGAVRDVVDSFDHAIAIWRGDSPAYIEEMKRFSERWSLLPVSPSAEQFSRVFFVAIDAVLRQFRFANGEDGVTLHSIIVHETDSGYAQCFYDDAYSEKMGNIALPEITFSDAVRRDWENPAFLSRIFA